MKNRLIGYYQYPVPPAFAHHMLDGIGLSPEDRKIAWAFRLSTGDTQFYADLARLPKKRFSERAAGIHQAEMAELIRLAQLGFQYEQAMKTK